MRLWLRSRARPKLPSRHRAWVVAKAAVVVWMVAYATFTPPATSAVLGAFVWTWVAASTAGIIVSIVGMLLAVQHGRSRTGRIVEMSGLIVATVGPLIHASTLTWIMVPAIVAGVEDATGRVGPTLQSVAIAAFLIVRFVEVRTRREVAV